MSPKYTSLEDDQVIVTKEPRPDLDALARWQRDDSVTAEETPESSGLANPNGVAGPVNAAAVTGGTPPLVSTTAGFSNPADIIDAEEALRRAQAAADADAAASKAAADAESTANTGADGQKAPAGGSEDAEPERPALNGTTEDWATFAKHPSIALDVADDAGRDDIVATYIEKFAPGGNASGKEWADYAEKHGVTVDEKDGRDKIRAATAAAGWAKA